MKLVAALTSTEKQISDRKMLQKDVSQKADISKTSMIERATIRCLIIERAGKRPRFAEILSLRYFPMLTETSEATMMLWKFKKSSDTTEKYKTRFGKINVLSWPCMCDRCLHQCVQYNASFHTLKLTISFTVFSVIWTINWQELLQFYELFWSIRNFFVHVISLQVYWFLFLNFVVYSYSKMFWIIYLLKFKNFRYLFLEKKKRK